MITGRTYKVKEAGGNEGVFVNSVFSGGRTDNSTGQWELRGMKIPYPVDFKTGKSIKKP